MRTVVGDRLARCLRHLWADPGVSLLELLIVVTVALILAGFALPTTAAAIDEGRGRQAAAFVAGRLRDAKQQAVTRTAAAGLVFDFTGGRWTFRLRVNKDTCVDGPVDVAGLFPGVSVAVDGSIRGPEGDAPSSDPVRFGASDLASFSPSGGCTAGSIFIRSARGAQYAVRVAGVTGRLRVLRYDAAARTWREL
jgi:prepilin-type N-terminal cleavage/methylation domain-containing protein